MGLLLELLTFLRKERKSDKKSRYIFYKIVDFVNEGEEFIMQCINTSAIFNATIMDIVFDVDILHGLHPIQACYIGIEYARFLKKAGSHFKLQDNQTRKSKNYSVFRYGNYQLCYQDRKGNVCFNNPYAEETFIMDPRDIALSEELIKEFDAAQAFHIGLFAGLKLNNPTSRPNGIPKSHHQNYLRLIK